MPAWAYDSYANHNVQEIIDEYKHNQDSLNSMIKDSFEQVLPDFPTICDLEFLVGLVIWVLRNGFKVEKYYLKTTNDIITFLIEKNEFHRWKKPESRISKLKSEKNILIKGLINKQIQESILKKESKKNLNDYL
jgi:hypothetical protein